MQSLSEMHKSVSIITRNAYRFIMAIALLWSSQGNCQVFHSLPSAVLAARVNSPFLKASGYNINMAESNLRTARLHTNPSLNNQTLILTDSKWYPKGTEITNPLNRQVWWQLTKPFVMPTTRHKRIELAEQQIQLTQKGFSDNVRNFSSEVAQQWLNAWLLRNKLDLLSEAYTNIDSLVRINRARLRNQVITQTDLIRTQLLQDQYRLQLINSEKEFRNEIQVLKFLMGVRDSVNVDTNAIIETVPVPESLDSLVNLAMRERPDVQAAQMAVMVAESNIRYQKSLVVPQPELGMIWNPQNTIPYLGFYGTLRIPLFDRNQGEIEKSKFMELQAREGVRNAELKLTTEIRAAYHTYLIEKENLKKYEAMLSQADMVLDNVRYAYVKGGTTIIDFLDAQRSWFDTRQLQLGARLAYFQSYIQLLYVTGLINQL